MANSTVELPNVGDIVYYKLLPCHLPTERNRKWKGKVIRASINQPRTIDHIKVELIEKGYEGLTELVYLEQIVHVSRDGLYNDENIWKS